MSMKVRIRMSACVLTAFAALVAAPLPSGGAAVPQLVSYEGTLANAGGQPVADAQYGVVFSIYDAQTGGTPLWTETWSGANAIATVNGGFSVLLGSQTPIPALFFQTNPTAYLGVRVGADAEMLPRQRISSVAYALASQDGVPTGGVIMWSGSVATIPAGWALCDGTNGTPDLRSRFVLGAGSAYAPGAAGGSATVNLAHTHATADHVLTAAEMPAHTHQYSVAFDTVGGGFPGGGDSQNHNWTGTTSAGGNAPHNHGATASGGAAAQNVMPPYYSLAYIMKL